MEHVAKSCNLIVKDRVTLWPGTQAITKHMLAFMSLKITALASCGVIMVCGDQSLSHLIDEESMAAIQYV